MTTLEETLEEIIEERSSFPSGALELAGILSYPEAAEPAAAALVLSPHPHFAGDLDNNVVRALAAGLAARGLAVLRFDYRGVGESAIELGAGESAHDYWERVEREKDYEPIVADAGAALAELERTVPGRPCHLVGYSFGAILAALLFARGEGSDLVAVAPPLRKYPFDFLAGAPRDARRQLFFLAENDFLYGTAEIATLRAVLAPPFEIETITGADHFFRGQEDELTTRIGSALVHAV